MPSRKVFRHFWVDWLYQLLRWDLLFNDGRVECGSLWQLSSQLLFWQRGECMYQLPCRPVVIGGREFMYADN